MTIEALAAVLFGLILYDDDLAVLHVIAEGEGDRRPRVLCRGSLIKFVHG